MDARADVLTKRCEGALSVATSTATDKCNAEKDSLQMKSWRLSEVLGVAGASVVIGAAAGWLLSR